MYYWHMQTGVWNIVCVVQCLEKNKTNTQYRISYTEMIGTLGRLHKIKCKYCIVKSRVHHSCGLWWMHVYDVWINCQSNYYYHLHETKICDGTETGWYARIHCYCACDWSSSSFWLNWKKWNGQQALIDVNNLNRNQWVGWRVLLMTDNGRRYEDEKANSNDVHRDRALLYFDWLKKINLM